MHHLHGKREPDYYYKSENTNTVFTAVPPKAVLSKFAGSQMTETGLVPIAYTFSVSNISISAGTPRSNNSSKISDVEKHCPCASQTLVFIKGYQLL